MSTHAFTRRRLLQLLGTAGITGSAATNLLAQARSSVSVENLRQASAIPDESFTDDRLAVIRAALQRIDPLARERIDAAKFHPAVDYIKAMVSHAYETATDRHKPRPPLAGAPTQTSA